MQSQSIGEQLQLAEEFAPPPVDSQFQLSPSRAVYLPFELIQKIHESCEKNTLKSVRLTCRDWNHAVISLLFDRVFISPREKDLEVFHNITECEHLAANIKELRIDATGASLRMSEKSYTLNLVNQLVRLFDRFPFTSSGSEPVRLVRLRFKEYAIVIKITKAPEPSTCGDGVELFAVKDSEGKEETPDGFEEVIRESHAKYLAMAVAEDEVLRSEAGFRSKLQSGVKGLIRLQSMVVDDGIWERHPDERFPAFDPGLWHANGFGPPAARSHNPMRLYPSPFTPNGIQSLNLFKAIAGALAVLPRPLTSFRISSNQNAGLMPGPSHHAPSDSWIHTDAFSALEYLEVDIRLQSWGTSTRPAIFGSLSSLLWRNQSSLRRLGLELGGYYTCHRGESRLSAIRRSNAYPYNSIFMKDIHMPNLVILALGVIAISANKLIDLLRLHCPKLQDLAIGAMDLWNGNWPGLLTSFRGLKLHRFRMSIDANYRQGPEQVSGPQETSSGASHESCWTEMGPFLNIPKLTGYVLGAPVHPCFQEYVWKGDLREYHRKVMSAIVCCWPESARKSVIDDYHAAIGTIQVPLESRLNLDWDGMGLTSLLPPPGDSPGQTIKSFMLRNT